MSSADRRMALRQMMAMAGAASAWLGMAGTARAAAPASAPSGIQAGTSQAPPLTVVKDKVAYVTGGSSGIGLGLVRVLLEAGMKVAMGYIDDKQRDAAMS